MDEKSTTFLNLRGCRGSNFKRFQARDAGYGSQARDAGTNSTKPAMLQACHYQSYEPLEHVSRDGEGHVVFLDHDGERQRPLIAHANGFHDRLAAALPDWRALLSSPGLLASPVHLFNSTFAQGGHLCARDALGTVLARAANATTHAQKKKLGRCQASPLRPNFEVNANESCRLLCYGPAIDGSKCLYDACGKC